MAGRARTNLRFNHAMVYVKDVRRALRFYRDCLGFVQIETYDYGGFPVYARLRSPAGGTTIALHQLEPGKVLSRTQGIRLYFETRNLNPLCKRLAARGVKFSQMPKKMPWGWTHAYLNDPDGHEVSLYWAGSQRLRRSKR